PSHEKAPRISHSQDSLQPDAHRVSGFCRTRFTATAMALIVAWGTLTSSANAAEGPAPASQQRQVLAGVHTDAVAVFAEGGGLVLETMADLDGEFGARLNPATTAFNVEESRRTTIPDLPAFAFLGTAGSDVWIGPESNPGGTALWPGFSSEEV